MSSEFGNPPAPQSEVVTRSTTNNPARLNAYTDPNLTKRNAVPTAGQTVMPPTPPPSGSTTLGNIRPVYANDKVQEIDQTASNPGVAIPAQAPNSWVPGRDPYKNQGMPGQEFFDNAAD